MPAIGVEQASMFISRLRTATAETRLTIALLALEQHYRRDQPRVPAGVPEGGQWTNERPNTSASPRRVALAARLIGQRVGPGDGKLLRHCIYQDMLGGQRTIELDAQFSCAPTIPAAPFYGQF